MNMPVSLSHSRVCWLNTDSLSEAGHDRVTIESMTLPLRGHLLALADWGSANVGKFRSFATGCSDVVATKRHRMEICASYAEKS